MRGMSVVIITATLVSVVGGALGEDRGDREPLERRHHLAPMRELRTTPERRGGLSDRDDSADSKPDEESSPRHDKSDGRGDHSRGDDDDE